MIDNVLENASNLALQPWNTKEIHRSRLSIMHRFLKIQLAVLVPGLVEEWTNHWYICLWKRPGQNTVSLKGIVDIEEERCK